MMRKWLALLAAVLLPVTALADVLPVRTYEFSGKQVSAYDSDTLRYSVEQVEYEGARCCVTKVWLASPGTQIRKATAAWEEGLAYPSEMAKRVDGAALVINGSGYVSPTFPWIPEDYPGTNSDYYYTPLGSLTVTDGVTYRDLPDVAYYGLTLQSDGLHLHVGDSTADVLACAPSQTWSFYVQCPMVQDHQRILDTDWPFANAKAMRTIIAQVDANNYVLLTVTAKISAGLTLIQAADFLQDNFAPTWVYDLDGGPSSALLVRSPTGSLRTLYGNTSMDADIMAFVE